MIHKSFGNRLKKCLELRNMKQKEFAKKLGVTECSISRYINDERQPKADMIVNMCRVLGVSADWLLGMIGEKVVSE